MSVNLFFSEKSEFLLKSKRENGWHLTAIFYFRISLFGNFRFD